MYDVFVIVVFILLTTWSFRHFSRRKGQDKLPRELPRTRNQLPPTLISWVVSEGEALYVTLTTSLSNKDA